MTSAAINSANLVIGVIRGYRFEPLRLFVESLRRSGYSGDIVMLCNAVPVATKLELKGYGVKCNDIWFRGAGAGNSWARFWPFLAPLLRCLGHTPATRQIFKAILPLLTVRFLYCRDYLKAHANYRNILITDVRDVVFQANPFSRFEGGLEAFQENSRVSVGEEAHNAFWMQEIFGSNILAQMAEYPVLCAGTILGERSALLSILEEFEKLLGCLLRIDLVGSDQAVYNFLCRKVTTQHLKVVLNGTGSVATVGTSKLDGAEVYFEPSRGILGSDNRLVPIVHQFDRHPELLSYFRRKFPEPVALASSGCTKSNR